MPNKRIIAIIFGLFSILYSWTTFATTQEAAVEVQLIKPYSLDQYENVINSLFNDADSQSNNVITRFDTDSQFFLNKPYLLGALGEGVHGEFDQDPLYRTDAFDCQTYVETVLALIESNNAKQFNNTILKIRYSANAISFLKRNHFVNVDWNPHNEQNGYLVDVTKSLYPNEYVTSSTLIDIPNWYRYLNERDIKLLKPISPTETRLLLQRLHDLANVTKPVLSNLDYVPLTKLFNKDASPNQFMFDRIPSACVIEIVRPNWNLKNIIGSNLDISHMGFAIREHGELFYREASSIEDKVIDIPLATYLKNYLKSGTVKGIHIEKIRLA